MKSLPIRLRLTLWYSILFALTAILLSATSWWMLRRATDAAVLQEFHERTDDIRLQLQQFGPSPSAQQLRTHLENIYGFRDDGKWLQILDQNGTWIYRSPRMVALGENLGAPASLPSAGILAEAHHNPRLIRTFSSEIDVNGRAYSVEVGASMRKPEALLRQFGLGLLLLTPAALLAALLAGHWMSRRALMPVSAITLEATRITERNLDLRLPVSSAKDEIAQLSITLNNMLARIDAGFRSVSDFTANASHELRSPLARLRAEIEIALLRQRSNEEYKDTLEHMQEETIEMTSLLDALLSLARSEVGMDAPFLRPIDLQGLIQIVVTEWSSTANELGIALDASITSDGDSLNDVSGNQACMVLGDRSSLLRLLRIWMDNACKFTPAGGKIAIRADVREDTIILAVEDSGIGIPVEEQQRVFERFYRVGGDGNKHSAGSGLGLSLAMRIAETHHTSIALKSIPTVGSSFQIVLKRCRRVTPLDVLSDIDNSVANRSFQV